MTCNCGTKCTCSCTGPQGSRGAQGFQGDEGAQGPQGDYGGPQGFQGDTGAQGATGSQGAAGSQGGQGFQGSQGNAGVQGNQGSAGSQGSQGNQGSTGAQGNQGFQGAFGGPQGSQGAQGSQGTQGTQGPQGFQGSQGSQGAIGAQGQQGATGAQGAQGPQGFQGVTGSQGPQGSQGSQGNQGFQGVAGSGSQGAQGAQGSQGSIWAVTATETSYNAGTNTYVVATTGAVFTGSIPDGAQIIIQWISQNTTATPLVNVDGNGAVNIKALVGDNLPANTIIANGVSYLLRYRTATGAWYVFSPAQSDWFTYVPTLTSNGVTVSAYAPVAYAQWSYDYNTNSVDVEQDFSCTTSGVASTEVRASFPFTAGDTSPTLICFVNDMASQVGLAAITSGNGYISYFKSDLSNFSLNTGRVFSSRMRVRL